MHALLVVAKKPYPGHTKTRLCPPLSRVQAAELYECFLLDTLEIMRQVPNVQRVIAFLAENDQQYFEALAPDMDLRPQVGKTLGERLDHLLSESLADQVEKAIVMDSDSPTLPCEYLKEAYSLLEESDVVLGPTEDGGYYLIGMKKAHPFLLREVKMSTSSVLQDTLILAKKHGVSVSMLPSWYDVDTPKDLERLNAELGQENPESGKHSRDWFLNHNWFAPRKQ